MSSIDPWFPYRKPNPQTQLRLFCFPYAGGNASVYRNWAENLPAEVELCAIQLPGRESRLLEKPFLDLSKLIPVLADAISPYFNLPFAFFGHSMGAMISFELTRYLRQQSSQQPIHLFVSGHGAPHIPDPDPDIHQLPEEEFIEEIRRYNGTPEAVLQNQELMQLLLPLLRADFTLVETYRYINDLPLDSPVSAYGGLQDRVTREQLDGWREHTRAAFKLRMFPGDHFFLQTARADLLYTISEDLFLYLRRIILG
ncbi:MAG: thioesterase domain-containing protein [Acidobacteriota bacterium]